MAYEMFSGHVPFKADSAVEIMAMHISAPPSPLSTTAPWVPPDVNQLVLSMLEKDARKRPSISQVREDLVTLFGSAAGRTTPLPHGMMPRNRASTPSLAQTEPSVTPPPSIAPSSGSKRGLVVGGAVVAALAIGGGLLLALNKKSAPAAAKEQPAQGSNVEVATKAPPPLPSPPDPTPPPTAGSDQGETPEVAAPPAAVPAKATGRVSITFSGPPSARVFIDGRAMGKETAGKVSFAVAAGEHTVRVQAKGFKAEEQKVRVGAGGNETVKLTLEKKRTVNSVEDPFAD
jgi:serine/threonine protein kinase